MATAVMPMNVSLQYFTGTTTYRQETTGDRSLGAPVYWSNSPLQLGIWKFASVRCPTRATMRNIKRHFICYDTLHVQYLNKSVRCFTDFPSITLGRVEKNSQGLKAVVLSNWVLGIVLNILGTYAAARFVYKFLCVFHRTRFVDVNFSLSCELYIMGPDTVPVGQLLILAVSNIPLMAAHHLPSNEAFGVYKETNFWVAQAVICLSLTWFIHVGIEIGRRLIHLHYPNPWFVMCMSRYQHLALFLVFAGRSAVPVVDGDYTQGMLLLIGSCIGAMACGALLICCSVLWDQPSARMSPLDIALRQQDVPRNLLGALVQSGDAWHLSGMLMEGWHVVDRSLYVGHGYSIPVTKEIRPYVKNLPTVDLKIVE